MQMNDFGPLASTMAIAAALVAVFGALVLQAIGRLAQWTWLIDDAPPFLVAAGARGLSIAAIAATFALIADNNFPWFFGAAGALGLTTFIVVARFDRFRRAHTCKIPVLTRSGNQAVGRNRKPLHRTVVIGSERDMRPEAKEAYKKKGGLSLCKFMSGYGRNSVNDPAAIWSAEVLAKYSSRLTILLMTLLVAATTGLFIAAAALEVSQKAQPA